MSDLQAIIGLWTDYSPSSVLGPTVTLSVSSGNWLLTALATWVVLVGSSLWSLVAFVLHQIRASPDPKDGLHRQHQLILRNQGSASSAALEAIQVYWAWRSRREPGHRVPGALWRSLLFSVGPFFIAIAFAVSGIVVNFVSNPTYQSSDIRVSPQRCGDWYYNTKTPRQLSNSQLKLVNDTQIARNYAKACYGSNQSLQQCSTYPVQTLPYKHRLVPCPFGNDPDGKPLCVPNGNQAFQLFTDYLDSNDHFGINAPPENRIALQYNLTCAPIHYQAYYNVTNMPGQDSYWIFNLGRTALETVGYTYKYDTRTRTDSVGYQLTTRYSSYGKSQNEGVWYPVAALNLSNADVSVHFLATNSIQYLEPVHDIWFSANQQPTYGKISNVSYEADNLVNVMACTDQYQICNRNVSPWSCTDVGGLLEINIFAHLLGFNHEQLASSQRLQYVLERCPSYFTVINLNTNALLANDRVSALTSFSLPSNQWQLEITGWFETCLAKMQQYVLEFAANSPNLGPGGNIQTYNSTSTNAYERALAGQCFAQRVRNTGAYQSFSFVGLMIVACLGTFIIALSRSIERIVEMKRNRWPNRHEPAKEAARIADRMFNLYHLAMVQAGYTEWCNELQTVPVTLGERDLPSTSYPVLLPSAKFENTTVEFPHKSPSPSTSASSSVMGVGSGQVGQGSAAATFAHPGATPANPGVASLTNAPPPNNPPLNTPFTTPGSGIATGVATTTDVSNSPANSSGLPTQRAAAAVDATSTVSSVTDATNTNAGASTTSAPAVAIPAVLQTPNLGNSQQAVPIPAILQTPNLGNSGQAVASPAITQAPDIGVVRQSGFTNTTSTQQGN